ncbi:YciI family protein [Corynebacterium hansenii]|uniref:YciI family protein n=1 Tax=Corynebacterium hansenii TaxID=394964 RepID=A0ABV7ZUP0_9CORY|nr:YciI family protein [Corynebacterium hansenii]WJY99792.1 YciI-like protein [Corynebacterium hansenii]
MTIYAVSYSYDPEDPRIAEVRPDHRAFIAGLKEKGAIIGSGPHPDAEGGALIVIRVGDGEDPASVMDADPFHVRGVLAGRTIREWNPVINIWDD